MGYRILGALRRSFPAVLAAALGAAPAAAGTLRFAGLEWDVKSGSQLGPGPNDWSESNAWVDREGRLHLRISRSGEGWSCAEVSTRRLFGHGEFRFFLSAPLDRLDRNVVVGLFSYPRPGAAPDGTNEIDIEFSQWGVPLAPRGHYSAWPADGGLGRFRDRFYFRLGGLYTTQRWYWGKGFVRWESLHGHRDGDEHVFAKRLFKPKDVRRIPRGPAKAHINLWLAGGRPPSDGREAEVVVADFRWTPFEDPAALLRRIAAAQTRPERRKLIGLFARQNGMDPDGRWAGEWEAALAAADPEQRSGLLSVLGRGLPPPSPGSAR